jgi:hypothetical protein
MMIFISTIGLHWHSILKAHKTKFKESIFFFHFLRGVTFAKVE